MRMSLDNFHKPTLLISYTVKHSVLPRIWIRIKLKKKNRVDIRFVSAE